METTVPSPMVMDEGFCACACPQKGHAAKAAPDRKRASLFMEASETPLLSLQDIRGTRARIGRRGILVRRGRKATRTGKTA